MSISLATTLLELIALALPAIGIYLQVLNSIQDLPGKTKDLVAPDESLNFALARTSLFPLAIAGVILIGYIMALQPPTIFPSHQNTVKIVLRGALYLSMVLLGSALLLFSASVGLRTKPSMMARPTKRGNVRLYLRLQYSALTDWLYNWWVDFRHIDTDDKRRVDIDDVVWADDQTETEDTSEWIAIVHTERRAQRIKERGWAEESGVDSEDDRHHLRLTETGVRLRDYYQDDFESKEEIRYQNPKQFIEDALGSEQARTSEPDTESGQVNAPDDSQGQHRESNRESET